MSTTVGFYREAWLVVASGGWWAPQEIADRIPLAIEVEEIHNSLWCMARRNKFLAVRGERGRPEYAVTADCRVPRGLTVAEVIAAASGVRA